MSKIDKFAESLTGGSLLAELGSWFVALVTVCVAHMLIFGTLDITDRGILHWFLFFMSITLVEEAVKLAARRRVASR